MLPKKWRQTRNHASHEESFLMLEQGVFKWVRGARYTVGVKDAKDEQR